MGFQMIWPEEMEPRRSAVYVGGEIKIAATPERVWRWLARAAGWPRWYSKCAWLRLEGGAAELAMGRRFEWKILGTSVRSMVRAFEPPREMGWETRMAGLRAYHRWMIEPDGSGSRVLSEETQNGALPVVAGWYLRRILNAGNREWLQALRRVAEAGDPD